MFYTKQIKKGLMLFLFLGVLSLTSIASAATITVNTDADNTTAGDGVCTLREAINNSNGDVDTTSSDCTPGAGADTIVFDLPGATRITVATELPAITDTVDIVGQSQGASSCLDKNTLEMELTTSQQGISGLIFDSGSNGSSLSGFYIHNFTAASFSGFGAVELNTEVQVSCNVFGIDATGSVSENMYGIIVEGANSVIGGPNPEDGNVISGSAIDGVRISGASTTNVTVSNNYIGTNIAGSSEIPNQSQGVRTVLSSQAEIGPNNVISGNNSSGIRITSPNVNVFGNIVGLNAAGDAAIPNSTGIFSTAGDLIIGGGTEADRNIISGNDASGIFIDTSDSNIQIQGNYIGVSQDGSASISNGGDGVNIEAIAPILIGGDTLGQGNVISGNSGNGIHTQNNSNGAEIKGNIIGLNAAGDTAVPNLFDGILGRANNLVIGGDTIAERNIISGNGSDGIESSFFYSGHTIQGNYIGVSQDGSSDIGNGSTGITATDSQIGGLNPGEGNIISGNGDVGLDISSGTIQGNLVGLNASGTSAIPNDTGGISAFGTAVEENIISGNTGVGLELGGDNATIFGNYIGTSSDGTFAVPNTSHGVVLSGDSIQVGSTVSGEENIISGNGGSGIVLDGTNIDIIGNLIGVSITEDATGNEESGIQVIQQSEQVFDGDGFVTEFSPSNNITIGGLTSDHSNTISANSIAGILVDDSNTNISILGNNIGTDSLGNVVPGDLVNDALGNGQFASAGEDFGGIIARSSSSVSIGNADGSGANVIAGNTGPGILVSQNLTLAESTVTILSNSIFSNSGLGIDLANDSDGDGFSELEQDATLNDAGDVDTGANSLQNFIELTAKTDNGANYTVDYTLDTISGDYLVQFYESSQADPSNYGEGETLLTSESITHTGGGSESFTATFSVTEPTTLVATVTQDLGGGSYGATSEFSSNEIIVEEPAPAPSGGGSNGSGVDASNTNPFGGEDQGSSEPDQETQPDVADNFLPDECNYERALKEIEKFDGFDQEISRYEALQYVLIINCIGLDELPQNPADYPFSDINLESEKLARVLYTGYNRGIVKGYPDGTFRPADPINYVELLAINARAQGLATDSQEDGTEWYSSYLTLGLTIRLAISGIDYADPITGDTFYLITTTFLNS